VRHRRTNTATVAIDCGSTYSPTDLIDPKSTLSGATPELRTANHLFVKTRGAAWLPRRLVAVEETHLQTEVANYLKGHFLGEPLRDWDVSRPAPYFGFEIPDSPGNYWYVWFDAPIGYLASTKEWCDEQGESFDSWWRSAETEIHHFIGKDITYFHTLFWPAMLKTAGVQAAHQGAHSRLSHGRRRKDVEVQGDVRQGRHVSQASRSGLLCGITSCRNSGRASTIST
jgi:methionyl-tRNA synthetase